MPPTVFSLIHPILCPLLPNVSRRAMGPKDRSRGKATRKLQVVEGVYARRMSLRSMANWVRGYKLTMSDGKSFLGAVYYELGKTFHCAGHLKFCENGLHFSKEALHARHIMARYSMRNVALWEVRAKPDRLKTDVSADGLAEKSITDELFMERKLSDAECKEKLTGWMHTAKPSFFDMGYGSPLDSDDSWVYYYKGTPFAFTACHKVGSKRVLQIGLMREPSLWVWTPLSSRREIDDSPETLEKVTVGLRQEVERYLSRILHESKQVSRHFQYDDEHTNWMYASNDRPMGVLVYRTPFDETDKNFLDFSDDGLSTHVASLEEATALVDRRLATGSYEDPAPGR